MNDLQSLTESLRRFAQARDWQQFHSPKNLVMALTVEAGELQEHFQWLTEAQSRALAPAQLEVVGEEVADVLFYLLQLADGLGIDVMQAALRKLAINEQKYPAELARGSSRKYDAL